MNIQDLFFKKAKNKVISQAPKLYIYYKLIQNKCKCIWKIILERTAVPVSSNQYSATNLSFNLKCIHVHFFWSTEVRIWVVDKVEGLEILVTVGPVSQRVPLDRKKRAYLLCNQNCVYRSWMSLYYWLAII